MQDRGKFRQTPPDPAQDSPLSAAVNQRDRNVLTMVRDAVERRDVRLAFQPVVQSALPGAPAFYEGLIRILDETGRIIPAREFMDRVETMELGRILDCLALEMGLNALKRDPTLRLAINMSARSIAYPRWTRILRKGLSEDRTVAERLILEITESSAMLVPDTVAVFMADLQSEGISFALDDFGAGFTSFRYLRDFYFDILKIDGQFIRGVADSPDNQVLTQAMLSLARHFDMFAVAESVETARDAAWLTGIGMDCLQGYYFGAPSMTPPWKLPTPAQRA
ncbi:EAL domain-containing protein [Defluviimonas sp. WL0024]|uniref:EAL domain-containing protein n=2 Tax=Albidovulum TaxID=205889 RepID=A0ABT3IYC0_9RHOB|nr:MULTISPECIES: EAL domain-containing protein [Defluviimonas]MCU9848583.1 EAL domain-containing protein [Defluviimonas sp. WL0024]MCW3780433.1 EAL domain-containing protein [Defluviimonas salinarum]